MTETIVIHRQGVPAGGWDEQGNQILAAGIDIPIEAIAIAPGTGVSSQSAAQNTTGTYGTVSENGYVLYLPISTDIRATDTLTIRGTSGWQVQGDAGAVDWVSPFTSWEPGTVAIVKRAS